MNVARKISTAPQMTMNNKFMAMSEKPAFFVMTSRSAVEKYVSGKNLAMFCSHVGMLESGKKVPPKNNMGNTIKFANAGTVSTVLDNPEMV